MLLVRFRALGRSRPPGVRQAVTCHFSGPPSDRADRSPRLATPFGSPSRFPLPVRPGPWCSNPAFDVCGVPIPPAVVARRLSWRVVPCGHLLLGLLVRVTSSPASLPKSHHSVKLVPDRSSTTERGQGAVAWQDGAGKPSQAKPFSEGGIGRTCPASSQSGLRGRSPRGEPGWSLTQPRGDRARRPAHSRPTAAQPTSASEEGSGTTNSDGSR